MNYSDQRSLAEQRNLLSLVYGETHPYKWAVHRGRVPLKRFIQKEDAWAYLVKLLEEKRAPT